MRMYMKPIEMLQNAGYEAYFVGGCVRDRMMGRALSDVDITTNAMPDEIKAVFADCRTLDFGVKHGTVTVQTDGRSYEITTYRYDGDYVDHRHPQTVRFGVSLTEDLARRDFTMNAIAWNGADAPKDPFGGEQDIINRVIRAVGEPTLRFEEDALRILRGLRFAATLGFSIEQNTVLAMRRCRELLKYVSAERIWQEMSKLIVGEYAHEVILKYSDVLEQVMPELAYMRGFDQQNPHHIYDVLTHTAVALQHAERDLVLRTALLFHDCGKPHVFSLDAEGVGHFYGHAQKSTELARCRLDAWRVDNGTKTRILRLIEHHDSPPETDFPQVVRKMRRLCGDYPMLVSLRRADNLGQAPIYHRTEIHDRCLQFYERAMAEDAEKTGNRLYLNGDDLLAAGAVPGKNIGFLLSELADAVLDGKADNEKSALLGYAKTQYKDRFGGTLE